MGQCPTLATRRGDIGDTPTPRPAAQARKMRQIDIKADLEVVLVEYAVRRDEYREVLSRLDILEHDVADVKDRIADLHRTVDECFDQMKSASIG